MDVSLSTFNAQLKRFNLKFSITIKQFVNERVSIIYNLPLICCLTKKSYPSLQIILTFVNVN